MGFQRNGGIDAGQGGGGGNGLGRACFGVQVRIQGLPLQIPERLRARRLQNSPEALAACLRGLGTGSQPSYWPDLLALRVPTRLIVGSEDGKFREIAAVLQINEGTVKSRMAQALQQLGKRLKPKINPPQSNMEFETKDAKEIV